jgi:hypothetical protein
VNTAGFAHTATLGSALILAAVLGTSAATWAAPNSPDADAQWKSYARSQQALDPTAATARDQAALDRAARGHGRCVAANLAPRIASGVVVSNAAGMAWYMTTDAAWAAHADGSQVTVRLFCYAS